MNKLEIKKNIYDLVEKYFSLNNQEFIPGKTKIGVGFPCYDHNEVISAIDSLLELRISQGEKVKQFEQNYSNYIGTKYGVAVNSGSSANLLALSALIKNGIVKKGSEVIVPAATFTTVVSPIIQNGLIPVFVDIDNKTYNISPIEIKKAISKKTGLIMPVHSFGCPANLEKIIEKDDKIPILEDCCEAHGASINKRKVGSYGLLSTYSFFVAHNITSGEGGIILTNNLELYKTLRSIREFGRLLEYDKDKPRFHYTDEYLTDFDERYVFEQIGYNVRMSDIHASLAIEQLKKLDELNKVRVSNAEFFTKHLTVYKKYLQLPTTPENSFHSFYSYPIVIKGASPFLRKDLVRFLEKHCIETRALMGGNLAIQPAYRNESIRIIGKLKNTQEILNNSFFIGCHQNIDEIQKEYIVSIFDKFFSEI